MNRAEYRSLVRSTGGTPWYGGIVHMYRQELFCAEYYRWSLKFRTGHNDPIDGLPCAPHVYRAMQIAAARACLKHAREMRISRRSVGVTNTDLIYRMSDGRARYLYAA